VSPNPEIPSRVIDAIESLGHEIDTLAQRQAELAQAAGLTDQTATRLTIFHSYIWVMLVAFVVTLCATPIMRRIAIASGIIDHPIDQRKVHRMPIAYLGGAAVFLGLLAGILFSYLAIGRQGLMKFHTISPEHLNDAFEPYGVPLSIVVGIIIITVVGLWDDVVGIPPWTKIGGQLFAAGLLAYEDVGTKVAAGVLIPVAAFLGIDTIAHPGTGLDTLGFTLPIPLVGSFFIDVVYWAGAIVIALFVLGGCNASNLVDGLDGLLTGVTSIAAVGLLFLALSLALADDGPRDAQRIILCMALLGACLGFLPHNFNPASIFLGDCGSMLLGFTTIVIILTLGDTGKTHLVFAGLFIYAIPIIDTVLAIVRRKLSGQSISSADDQHLHHMLKRALGVKGAVLTLYALGVGFAALGVAMSLGRARVSYALALLFASYVGVTAIKVARIRHIEGAAATAAAKREGSP